MGDERDKTRGHIPSSTFIVGQHRTGNGQTQPLKLRSEGVLSVLAPLAERSKVQANFGRKDSYADGRATFGFGRVACILSLGLGLGTVHLAGSLISGEVELFDDFILAAGEFLQMVVVFERLADFRGY